MFIHVDLHNPQTSNWFDSEMARHGKFATIFHGDGIVTVLMTQDAYGKAVRKGILPRSQELRAARVTSSTEVRGMVPVLSGQSEAILLWDGQEDPLVLVFSENTWVCGIIPDLKVNGLIKRVEFVTEKGVQCATEKIIQ